MLCCAHQLVSSRNCSCCLLSQKTNNNELNQQSWNSLWIKLRLSTLPLMHCSCRNTDYSSLNVFIKSIIELNKLAYCFKLYCVFHNQSFAQCKNLYSDTNNQVKLIAPRAVLFAEVISHSVNRSYLRSSSHIRKHTGELTGCQTQEFPGWLKLRVTSLMEFNITFSESTALQLL